MSCPVPCGTLSPVAHMIVANQLSSKHTSHRYSTYSTFAASPAFTSSHLHPSRPLSTITSTTATLETQGLLEIRH